MDSALSYLPLVMAWVNGQKFASEEMTKEEKANKPYALSFKIQDGVNIVGQYELDDPAMPENSVAVIPIQGVILSWNSMNLVANIQQAGMNPSINSILFLVNSPGGMVFYTDIAATEIKNCKKPTVACIMNMGASAAMWMISAMDYRICTSPMDWVGSIGTMMSFMDFSRMLKEKLSIDIYEIYADDSSRKNEMLRQLREGNDTLVKQDLKFVNDIFHQTILDNLKLPKDSEVFQGATYNATDGLRLGLIDEINTVDYAIDFAYKKGLSFKALNIGNQIFKQS